MRHIRQDIREAVRRFHHDPAFASLAALTLALGIGANTAMFSVIRTVLLAPLPYGDPARIVMIWNPAAPSEMTWLSAREVVTYADASRAFARLSAYGEANASLTGGTGEPERVRSASTKTDLFAVLAVQPVIGRGFVAADGAPGAAGVVILGEALWQRRFGGDAAVLGRQIEINGSARTVIGVMPAAFRLPLDYRRERPTEIFVPLPIDPANLGGWGDRGLIGVARLETGINPTTATGELDVIGRRWVAAGYVNDLGDGRFRRAAIPVAQFISGNLRMPLAILLGTVACVLLIALANVRSERRVTTAASETVNAMGLSSVTPR